MADEFFVWVVLRLQEDKHGDINAIRSLLIDRHEIAVALLAVILLLYLALCRLVMEAHANNERALTGALALSLAYLVVEIVGGIATGSLALLADAGHMLTDVGGLALAIVAIRFARRPATVDRTYGYQRAEILAAVVNSVVLLGISAFVLVEAYRRFLHPPEVQSGVMLAVAVVGLMVNALSLRLLKGGAHGSLNVKGAYFEVLSDFVTSIGVIVGAAIMWKTGWFYVDPLISAGIGLFIVPRTWVLLREAVGILLEGTPKDIDMTALREALSAIDGVAGVHDLHVWTITSGVNALSVHIVCRDGLEARLLSRVDECAKQHFQIAHTTVQIEPPGWPCHGMHL